MLWRAFRGAFGEDELDDIYASAWVGTLRALESRHAELGDDEIRSYLFTAVAHQAGKELRRRKRKPVAPLELAVSVADRSATSPEESATTAEESRVTRDLLASLPSRRRAVILLRYGWGLEPKQICGLIKGLSPRAYRKEITKGIDELTEKIRRFERGEWCTDREPVLKAYASGLAGVDEEHQAQAHLAHCRACSDFVAKLSGHLHDLGATVAIPGAIDGLDGHVSVGDRLLALGDRAREAASGLLGRADNAAQEAASTAVTAGGTRGAGLAGAGLLAKVAGLGTAGKLALACAGGSAAITACVAAGVGPLGTSADNQSQSASNGQPTAESNGPPEPPASETPVPDELPSQVGYTNPAAASAPTSSPGDDAQSEPAEPTSPGDGNQSPPAPVSPATPSTDREFGVEAAATPVEPPSPTPATPPDTSGSSPSTSSDGTSASAVKEEFGP
jgi:RNA polymerase sigma factor (sigma-70 family)